MQRKKKYLCEDKNEINKIIEKINWENKYFYKSN